jgi:hypothetical protein
LFPSPYYLHSILLLSRTRRRLHTHIWLATCNIAKTNSFAFFGPSERRTAAVNWPLIGRQIKQHLFFVSPLKKK